MTSHEIIEHWRKGAHDALEMAQLACEAGKYEHALFNCHLAVEKALKVAYMEQHHEDHPHTHDLYRLASLLKQSWTEKQKSQLEELTRFVIESRYADPNWAKEYAKADTAKIWIGHAASLLSILQT